MSEDDILKLKWNGHLSSFLHIFQSLRTKSRYTDVTLACEGRLFTVHRLVLASCSQFFDHIFEQTPSENTVIVLNEAKAHDIESLLDYMYCGQVDVQQRDLGSFIRTARCLQIKGLASPDDIRNFVEEEILDDQPYKKRKSNCVPSVDSTPTQNVMPSFPISTIGTKIDISKKAISASSPNTLPSCWVFQQSDLPNTTWSSSPNSKLDDSRSEKENYPQREYIENNVVPVNCNKNLIIDESPAINSSPHSNNLNNFQYISNLPGSTDGAHSCRLNKDVKDDYYHRNSDFNEEPIDFKKEIKDEEDDKFCKDNRNHEKYVEYSPARYPVISELDHSPEVVENYDQFSDLSSAATCENQTLTDSPRIISQSRPLIPLKFVKKVTPTTIPPAGWRNCPGTKPISEHDSNVGPIRSTSSNNQSSVSPKLMLYAKCSNCQTNNTKLWRRSLQGEIVCNACGLYYKLHGVNRPSHLFRNAPMTRRRTPRSKKKRSYDQILDGREREQQLSVEELNDSLYNESGCESDTQESLAMLNAALTLNSLLAKAKAQEAAVKNLEIDLSASPSNARVGCDSSSTTNEGLPPPPPLLKISLQSSGAINQSSHQAVGHSPPTSVITLKSHTTDSSTTNSVIIGLNESRPPSHSDCEDLSTKS